MLSYDVFFENVNELKNKLEKGYSQVPNRRVGPNKRVGWLC